MTLNELKYVLALVREKHFGKAAASCGVAQPSLSVAVKKLEEELGVALFERRAQQVLPTAVGLSVAEEARKVFGHVERIRDVARQGLDPLAGPFRLGIIYTVCPYLVPSLIREVTKSAPSMPLVLEENFTENLLEALRKNEIDAAIVALPVTTPGMMIAPLYEEEFIVAVPKDHPFAGQKKLSRADIATERLLLLSKGHCMRDQVLDFCPESENASVGVVNGTTLFTIREMVAQGLGITLLPASSVPRAKADADIAFGYFAAPKPTRRIVLVWRQGFNRLEAIETLRGALSEVKLNGCRALNLPVVSTVS
ncbi:MAG TPA: LysR family transcriptional regulator [Sutterella sp.]|nr:LysR family transcriptional regulator [Sutterella sp.]